MIKTIFAAAMLACVAFVMPVQAADRSAPARTDKVEAAMIELAAAAGQVQIAQSTIRKVRPGDRTRGRGLGREGGSRASPGGWSCYGQGTRRTCTNRTWTCKYGVQRCWNKSTRRWHVMQNGRIGRVWTYRPPTRTPTRRTYSRRRNNRCMRVSTRTTLKYCQQICRRFGTTKCRAYVRWNKSTHVCSYVQGSC